ncbi:MAG: hypothetical protein HY645_14345 [Acidobacteria bacterium]|nr:hypothetical protein [Acidobacteriota bacterium]
MDIFLQPLVRKLPDLLEQAGMAFLPTLPLLGMVFLAAKLRSRWGLAVMVMIPVAALFANPDWRIFSHHGLMHFSIVYELYQQGTLPENSLFAGESLRYPYGYHVVVAFLVKLLNAAPSWLFIFGNLLALALLVFLLDSSSQMISQDWKFRSAAVMFCLAGPSIFTFGPLLRMLDLMGIPAEYRLIPLHKFTTVSSNPLGLAFFALTLLGAMKAVRDGTQKATLLCMATGLIGVRFFYPVYWPVAALAVLTAPLFSVTEQKLRSAIGACVLVALTGLLTLLMIQWFRWGGGFQGLLAGPRHLLRNSAVILPNILLMGLLLVWRRSRLRESGDTRRLLLFLLCFSGSALLLYLVAHLPTHAEYKYLSAGLFTSGIVGGWIWRQLLEKKKLLALLVLFLTLLPFGAYLADRHSRWKAVGGLKTEGKFIVRTSKEEQDLYRWILERTPSDAVFIDDEMDIPPLSHRVLFIGLDGRYHTRLHNGWGMPVDSILKALNGVDPQAVEKRRRLALTILQGEVPTASPDWSELEHLRASRPIYVVSRNGKSSQKLAASGLLRQVHSSKGVEVFQIAEEPHFARQ